MTLDTVRSFHLIDIENLAGDGLPAIDDAELWLRRYVAVSRWQPGDLTVIAANRWLGGRLCFAVPRALSHRFVLAPAGRDAADRALMEAADAIDAAHRFDRVVLGSGDHYFAPLAEICRAAGTPFEVVAGKGKVSWRLRRLADRCLQLRPPAAIRLPELRCEPTLSREMGEMSLEAAPLARTA